MGDTTVHVGGTALLINEVVPAVSSTASGLVMSYHVPCAWQGKGVTPLVCFVENKTKLELGKHLGQGSSEKSP